MCPLYISAQRLIAATLSQMEIYPASKETVVKPAIFRRDF